MALRHLSMPLAVMFLMVVSCVEISERNIDIQDYKSEVRFANLSNVGSVTITLSDTLQDLSWSFGSIDIGEASDYQEVNSGSRTLIVDFADVTGYPDTTRSIIITTDRKSTVFMLGDTTLITYVNAWERYTFNEDCCDDSSLVRVVNGSLDSVIIEFEVTVSDTSSEVTATGIEESISYTGMTSYQHLFPSVYSVTVDTSDVVLFSDTLTFEINTRYTVAVYDSLIKTFEED